MLSCYTLLKRSSDTSSKETRAWSLAPLNKLHENKLYKIEEACRCLPVDLIVDGSVHKDSRVCHGYCQLLVQVSESTEATLSTTKCKNRSWKSWWRDHEEIGEPMKRSY